MPSSSAHRCVFGWGRVCSEPLQSDVALTLVAFGALLGMVMWFWCFKRLQGVHHPSSLLLAFGLDDSGDPVIKYTLCPLPAQLGIYIWYAVSAFLSLAMVVAVAIAGTEGCR